MLQLTEQQIASIAPNAAAAANGKKISQKGGFVRLECSTDGSFYLGECTGSGRSNYITSADYVNPDEPVFRCSCPSRQFPCKHSIGLLYEIFNNRSFLNCEIPEDILNKRAKKKEKAEKTSDTASAPPKVNKAAKNKKIKKQLEGLSMTSQVIDDLLTAGLGTLKGTSLKTYRDLAKQLGDYYLPGPQLYINRLILEAELIQEDPGRNHEAAVRILIKLRALIKKATKYLNEKQENDNMEYDDSILYEELGGIWKTDQLQQIGLLKENASLVQLSFQVYLDKARGDYVDLGYWADLDTGEILTTLNYRPLTALKYIKEEDSIFEMLQIPKLTYYPGDLNRRVRFEGAKFSPIQSTHYSQLRDRAFKELPTAIKTVKNYIKNTLSDHDAALLLKYRKIGMLESGYALEDMEGNTILLLDMPGMEATVNRLSLLTDASLFEGQVLLALFHYDGMKHRILVQPLSIITNQAVIRLLY